jgi:DNA helicase-2/ATP-dependent DNA helicase PcrA
MGRHMRKIRLKPTIPAPLLAQFDTDLNETQRLAATAPDGANLILAGPGSGKTRVITYRVAYLIARGVPAGSILLVTFTRRAAREMVHRLEGLVGPDAAKVWAGTFHHVGNRLLRQTAPLLGYQPNFTILDSEDQLDLMRLAMTDAGLAGKEKMAPKPAQVLHFLSFGINTGQTVKQVVAARAPDLVEWVSGIEKVDEAFAARKRAANSVDYDDLLVLWRRLLQEFPDQLDRQARMFRHILVDEMQDTNALQMGIVESIARAGEGNLTAVGDDAQSIYRFRGANYDNILKFPERHPGAKVFALDVNYRSTPQVVALTNASIARNKTGFAKDLTSARSDGLLPTVVASATVFEEASVVGQLILEARDSGVALGRMAVLYRNHYDSIVLQGELLNRGIPYTIRSGMRFFEQAHVKDVLAYLRVVANPSDEASWRRLLLLLPGIGSVKAAAVFRHISQAPDPLKALESAETMAVVPPKSRGFFAAFVGDVQRIRGTGPERNPAAAIAAVLKGGYRSTLKEKYDRADNRLADLEQFAVLASKYESLEQLLSDLLLAGDVYGIDSTSGTDSEDVLVLSTVHQAKGLEWSHVFVIRLIEETFPHYRSLGEPDGEEEERRIFYVAVSRAMNELTLTYPSSVTKGSYGPTVFTTPSRFITEIPETLYERAEIERDDLDDEWDFPATGRGRRR